MVISRRVFSISKLIVDAAFDAEFLKACRFASSRDSFRAAIWACEPLHGLQASQFSLRIFQLRRQILIGRVELIENVQGLFGSMNGG